MDTEFIDEFADCLKGLFRHHHPVKGDSWKDCDMEFLNNKLLEEMNEVENSGDFVLSRMGEIEDMALVAAMVWKRESDRYEAACERLAKRLPDNFALDPAAHR